MVSLGNHIEVVYWNNLKFQMLICFRPSQEANICACFLAIQQDSTMANYYRRFEEMVAPLVGLTEDVLKSTFIKKLHTIRLKFYVWRPYGWKG